MAAWHTPHTMNHELLKAVSIGDTDLLAQILGVWSTATAEQDEEILLQGVTAQGSSALHIAASHGYLEPVVMICTHDRSLIKARNNYLDTPLICAARAGHTAVVRYLVELALAEHEHNVLRMWNAAGATAMHEAVRNGHVLVVQTLMLRYSMLATVVDGKGISPLYLAILSNRADIVEILVRESCDGMRSPASYAGPNKQTALHSAVYSSKAEEICERLLRWEPALGEKVDDYGRTALHYAAQARKIRVVKLLLISKSSLAYIPDNDGQFPVHAAALGGKVNVIREFMRICPSIDELLDNKHRNILHCAIEHDKLLVVWHICRNQKLATMLNAVDSGGNTPLHLAVKHGNIRIFSLLMMDIRVNLGIINHAGLTPLEVAINRSFWNFSFSALTNSYMELCLDLCEGYPGVSQNLTKLCMEKKESSFYTDVSQSISCISALIAAGSFAAAFTPPGGYKAEGADAGMPILGHHEELTDFVAYNCTSFFCSTFATCLLVHASLTNLGARRRYLFISVGLVSIAIICLVLTFVNTVHLMLDPEKSLDDFILNVIIGLVKALLAFSAIIPFVILLAPICVRVSMQLPKSKHKLKDILKVVFASIIPLTSVWCFVSFTKNLVELISDTQQGDIKYLHPT